LRLLYILVLGIVQGLTEFLPVSSSGHLVFLQYLFGLQYPGITLEIALHVGTLAAVVAIYWRDLLKIAATVARATWSSLWGRTALRNWFREPRFYLGFSIVLGSAATALVILLLQDTMLLAYDRIAVVGGAWLLTGLALWSTRGLRPRGRFPSLGATILIGLMQATAVIPGISRSGATIATGIHCGLSRREAARFSFLLSVPAIIGATLTDIRRASWLISEPQALLSVTLGTAVAAVTGYLALRLLLRLISRGRLHSFSPYLWLMGAATLLGYWLG